MAVSQNGWTVHTSPKGLVDFPWVTGRVLGGDVYEVFAHLARRFDAEVEPIIKAHSWGYANRDVRGGGDKSNHASATAVDFNAPAHPLGKRGTFSPAQVRKIDEILGDLDGVMRWGGNYQGRADEMHFELVKDAAAVARVAAKLRGLTAEAGPTPREELDPMLYISGNNYVVLGHNGGWVSIPYTFSKAGQPKTEYENLVAKLGEPVWVNPNTLAALIADGRDTNSALVAEIQKLAAK